MGCLFSFHSFSFLLPQIATTYYRPKQHEQGGDQAMKVSKRNNAVPWNATKRGASGAHPRVVVKVLVLLLWPDVLPDLVLLLAIITRRPRCCRMCHRHRNNKTQQGHRSRLLHAMDRWSLWLKNLARTPMLAPLAIAYYLPWRAPSHGAGFWTICRHGSRARAPTVHDMMQRSLHARRMV
jgi:hypothetical protein